MRIELSAGPVEYEDSGGDGPVLVFLHGLLMDSSLWASTVAALPAHRCVVPTLPLGAHRLPMSVDADLSLPGIAQLVTEFIERLGLRGVTLIGNDTGGALVQLLMPSVERAVLISCDAFDNFPPGLTGKTLVATGRLSPALFGLFMQQMRLKSVRRLPIAFGWLTKRGDAATARWMRPILQRSAVRASVRRDTVRVLRSIAATPNLLVDAAERLPDFDRPALVVWASEDRVMPVAHARRLVELLPQSKLIEVEDSYTLVPLDQPLRLAEAIGEFVAG
jgi:pimeloyl-ACP methyl ester carboxylesterase